MHRTPSGPAPTNSTSTPTALKPPREPPAPPSTYPAGYKGWKAKPSSSGPPVSLCHFVTTCELASSLQPSHLLPREDVHMAGGPEAMDKANRAGIKPSMLQPTWLSLWAVALNSSFQLSQSLENSRDSSRSWVPCHPLGKHFQLQALALTRYWPTQKLW